MSKNALKYLLSGFNSGYDSSLKNYYDKKERNTAYERQLAEDKAKQAEKDREAQAKTTEQGYQGYNLRALLGDTTPTMDLAQTPMSIRNTGRPRTLGNMNQYQTVNPELKYQIGERPKTMEDQIKLISESSSDTLGKYNTAKKELNPKKDTFVFDGTVYPKDENGNIDFNNPLKEKTQPTVEYKDLKPEHVAGQIRLRKEKYIDGKLAGQEDRYIAPRERKGSGISYVSKDMQKEFDKFHINSKVARAKYATSHQTNSATLAADKKALTEVRLDQVNFIKQAAPKQFNKVYDKVWNKYGKKDPDNEGKFVQEFLNAYQSGAFNKTIKIRHNKTGKVETITDPGVESIAYFKELARALYGDYPDLDQLDALQGDDTEVIEEN